MPESGKFGDLSGKSAIVTGGASGIGEAVVRAFADRGARVGFLDLDAASGEALAADLRGQGATVAFRYCDLCQTDDLRAAMASLAEEIGPPSVLVNNAANDRRHAFDALDEAEFDFMVATNLRHVVFASQVAVGHMRRLGGGSIINMTSGAWVRGMPDMQAYCACKAAIVGFTNSLARQVGKYRIRVNALAPGMVVTARQRRLWYPDEAKIEAGRALQCIPGAVEAEDVADAAVFLASDQSRMVTKQMFLVNAGLI